MKERRRSGHLVRKPTGISTHAPVKERLLRQPQPQRKRGISTHAPVKERLRRCTPPAPPTHFNSRSCEGATARAGAEGQAKAISTHAPVKERRRSFGDIWSLATISTHAPVKERHRTMFVKEQGHYFNSRSCEGATYRTFAPSGDGEISTHAPVKERPTICKEIRIVRKISTHAPVKERQTHTITLVMICVGRDLRECALCSVFKEQSIQ